MINFNLPHFAFSLPWFMFDMDNKQLILSKIIPSDITDSKPIILTENPIPGLNYSPIVPGGGGNRKISFTLPLIKRNNTVGNVLLLKQIDNLRNQKTGLLNLFSPGQFTGNPQVLYYWGTGSLPLVYYVAKADATHKQGWVNQLGQPQYSEIEFELWLDETHPLYRAEELFRKVSSLTGQVIQTYDLVENAVNNTRPY